MRKSVIYGPPPAPEFDPKAAEAFVKKLFKGEMNPDKEAMHIVKRKRFCQIMREGKRICRLEPEERQAVILLCKAIEARTKKMEREK